MYHAALSEFLAVGGHKNGRFLARIRIFRLGDPQLVEQASRGGAIALDRAMAQDRLPRKVATFGTNSEHDPCDALYERYMGCLQRIAIPERYPSDKRGPDLSGFTAR